MSTLYGYLGNLGFTGTFQERIRGKLLFDVNAAGGGTLPATTTTNDMWIILGSLSYPAVKTINEIQKLWAVTNGAASGDFNDMFANLP